MFSIRNIIFGSVLIFAASTAMSASAVVSLETKYNWSFVGDGGIDGQGKMTVSAEGLVTAMTGKFDGMAIKFYANPSFPSTATLHGVPNTGGADFIYDDAYDPTTGVDVNGLLISTGSHAKQVFYDISLDYSGATETDFFSITKTGGYVYDDGVFTVTPVRGGGAVAGITTFGAPQGVPEPASWALMLVGLGLGGGMLRGARQSALAIA